MRNQKCETNTASLYAQGIFTLKIGEFRDLMWYNQVTNILKILEKEGGINHEINGGLPQILRINV